MKFINEKGKIEDGTPLTNMQFLQRERLIPYFHKVACLDSYHTTYSQKQCEELANAFITGGIESVANTDPETETSVDVLPEGSLAAVAPGFASA
jgi:hypothetical protein